MTEQKQEEVKRCPFCGGDTHVNESPYAFQIECYGCYAKSAWSESLFDATRLWNTRANEKQADERGDVDKFLVLKFELSQSRKELEAARAESSKWESRWLDVASKLSKIYYDMESKPATPPSKEAIAEAQYDASKDIGCASPGSKVNVACESIPLKAQAKDRVEGAEDVATPMCEKINCEARDAYESEREQLGDQVADMDKQISSLKSQLRTMEERLGVAHNVIAWARKQCNAGGKYMTFIGLQDAIEAYDQLKASSKLSTHPADNHL